MPTTVVRLSGTTFLILEPGDNLFMPLKFVLLRSRLIPSLCSDSLLTGMDFLETLLLLFSTVLVLPTLYLLLRPGLPVVRGTEVFLSLTKLPIRDLLLKLIRLVELPADGLWVVRVVGFLVVIELPIRELLLKLIRLAELPADGLWVVRAVGCLVVIELPIRELLLELIRLAELPADGLWVVRVVGFLVVIELPIRELLLELIRLVELADDCLAVPELTAVGLLLLRELVLRSDVLRGVELLDGLRVLDVIPGRVVTGRLTVTLLG